MNRFGKILVVVLCLLIGYRLFPFGSDTRPTWPDTTQREAVTDAKNATYLIDNVPVGLVDGRANGDRTTTTYFGNDVHGDFDGNGTEDMAFLLTHDPGGSGTFFYVVAALKTESGHKGTNAVLLGDRIAPQTTEFRDGQIIVNYAERRAGEPMTARPSMGVSKYLRVIDGRLMETEQADRSVK